MKKHFKAALIFMAVTLGLITGCSSKTPKMDDINIDNIEDKLNSMSDNEIADAISDAADKLDNSGGDNDNSDSSEEETYELFPAADGWKNTDLRKLNVQVDDVLYTPGMSADDFIKQLEGSSIEYEYSYDPDKLVTSNKSESIDVYRNGEKWLMALAYNPAPDASSISSLPIVYVMPEYIARPFSRFVDGRSYDELCSLTYDDVKALNSLFEDAGFKYTEEKSLVTHDIEPKYKLSSTDATPIADWTGYSLTTDIIYYFNLRDDASTLTFNLSKPILIFADKIEE